MTPIKPNIGNPITTPKIVISGWVSAIFFCSTKRIKLSTCVMITMAYMAMPTAFHISPVVAI